MSSVLSIEVNDWNIIRDRARPRPHPHCLLAFAIFSSKTYFSYVVKSKTTSLCRYVDEWRPCQGTYRANCVCLGLLLWYFSILAISCAYAMDRERAVLLSSTNDFAVTSLDALVLFILFSLYLCFYYFIFFSFYLQLCFHLWRERVNALRAVHINGECRKIKVYGVCVCECIKYHTS